MLLTQKKVRRNAYSLVLKSKKLNGWQESKNCGDRRRVSIVGEGFYVVVVVIVVIVAAPVLLLLFTASVEQLVLS